VFRRRFILIALIALVLLSGCGRSGEKVLTLAVGGAPKEIEVWEAALARFEAETGIRVSLIRQPTDTAQRRQGLVVPLQAGQADPDVFLMDVAWLAQFAASDWLAPLDEFMAQGGLDRSVFFERVLALADVLQDRLVALPMNLDGGLLYYRADLLEKFGLPAPPRTWAELVRQALLVQEKLRPERPGFYGFVWPGAQYEGLICVFLEFAASNQAARLIEGGRVRLNTPANLAALSLMRDLIGKFKVSPPNTYSAMKEEEVRLQFQRGDALFERNWPYAWGLHQAPDSPVRGRVGLARLPHFQGGRSASTLGGWHLGLSRFSESQPRAWRLIEFLVSAETQKRFALDLGWTPGRRDVYADPEVLGRMPHFRELKDVFENLQPRPIAPYWSQVSRVLQRHLNAALGGGCSPEEALRQAEAEARAVVERYAGQ